MTSGWSGIESVPAYVQSCVSADSNQFEFKECSWYNCVMSFEVTSEIQSKPEYENLFIPFSKTEQLRWKCVED